MKVLRVHLALDHRCGGRRTRHTGHPVEQRLRRVAGDDRIGDRVGVLLVDVASPAEPILECNAAALLDDVRGFVRRGVEIGLACKRDAIADRVRASPEGAARRGGVTPDLAAHASDVVAPKRCLNGIFVRDRSGCARDAMRGDWVTMVGAVVPPPIDISRRLDGLRQAPLHGRSGECEVAELHRRRDAVLAALNVRRGQRVMTNLVRLTNRRKGLDLFNLVVFGILLVDEFRQTTALFSSSPHAEAAAAIFSVIASCRLHRLDPYQYLDEILRLLPYWPKDRYLELSPKYWPATRARLNPKELAAPLSSFEIPPPLGEPVEPPVEPSG